MKILVIATIFLAGCAEQRPCWYGNKAVSQYDANHMKAIGMNVHCPGDDE